MKAHHLVSGAVTLLAFADPTQTKANTLGFRDLSFIEVTIADIKLTLPEKVGDNYVLTCKATIGTAVPYDITVNTVFDFQDKTQTTVVRFPPNIILRGNTNEADCPESQKVLVGNKVTIETLELTASETRTVAATHSDKAEPAP